jgi:hypothetical protein
MTTSRTVLIYPTSTDDSESCILILSRACEFKTGDNDGRLAYILQTLLVI